MGASFTSTGACYPGTLETFGEKDESITMRLAL